MKSKNSRRIVFSLAGGLGNQLFQLAAGIALSENHKLYIERSLANPRETKNGTLEVERFLWPAEVEFLSVRTSPWLEKRLGNFLLRLSSKSSSQDSRFGVKALQISAISKLLSHLYWNGLKIQVCRGVGYDQNLESQDSLTIGYFQCINWVERKNVYQIFHNLALKSEPTWLASLRVDSAMEKPLILHIRLGDYKSEKTFGTPSLSYYEGALLELWGTSMFRKIWIFSDEPELALKNLPKWVIQNSRVITEAQDSPAETIEAMRLGFGYVISNSTFGWWGAYLSHHENAPVIAPMPWFKLKEEPLGLIPNNWVRKEAWE